MKIVTKALLAFIGLALIGLSLAVPQVLAAGSESSGKANQRYKFVVITHAAAVPFFVPVRKGAEDAGKLVGADVTYTGPSGFDIEEAN